MEKAFTVHLVNYAPILKSAGIRYKEDEKTLLIGKPSSASGFVILISSRTMDTPKLLNVVLPIFKKSKAAYRIIKSQNDQYRLNSGAYGDDEAGKVIIIFPSTLHEAKLIAEELIIATTPFKGPVVMNAQRIGQVVYIQKVQENIKKELILSAPELRNFPFKITPDFKQSKSRFGMIGNCYLPVKLLRSTAKGDIYKAVNLRRFKFDWCLIKQGKPVAMDDHFDRDMKDRLLWQKEVHEALRDKVYTPNVLDYFCHGGSHYLVLNYADGDSLGTIVRNFLSGMQWKNLDENRQTKLLDYFLQAVNIVKTIHEEDFVHRDLTDGNFIVMDTGKLCVIDFELSYSLKKNEPTPPFLLGTYGYVAPEQIQYAVPDKSEDVYSLGALLCFVLTACKTWEFITTNKQQLRMSLMRLTNEEELTNIILKCLSHSRTERPTLDTLAETIQCRIFTSNQQGNEKLQVAN